MSKPSKMQQRLAMPKNKRLALGASPFVHHRQGLRAVEIPPVNEITPEEKRYIVFMSRQCVKRYKFKPDDVLLSISDPCDSVPELAVQPKAVLQLNYMAYPSREDKKEGKAFSSAHALQIATFLKLNTDTGNIIVHCSYGEQRSFAMAAVLAAYFEMPFYTVSPDMKLINPPKYGYPPTGDYSYHVFKALDQFYVD